jgi:predicted DNA-binding transcriptional regulator AlpA
MNRIGGIMVSVFASSEIDSWFESHLDQTKDYKIVLLLH